MSLYIYIATVSTDRSIPLYLTFKHNRHCRTSGSTVGWQQEGRRPAAMSSLMKCRTSREKTAEKVNTRVVKKKSPYNLSYDLNMSNHLVWLNMIFSLHECLNLRRPEGQAWPPEPQQPLQEGRQVPDRYVWDIRHYTITRQMRQIPHRHQIDIRQIVYRCETQTQDW